MAQTAISTEKTRAPTRAQMRAPAQVQVRVRVRVRARVLALELWLAAGRRAEVLLTLRRSRDEALAGEAP